MSTPYEQLKALQQALRAERGRKTALKDLVVLASQHDPYYTGTETDLLMAEWFAEVFGGRSGAHLRRIHYRLLASGDSVRHDGTPYLNNAKNWQYLNRASKYARYLGLVDPEDIVDQRKPEPHVNIEPLSSIANPDWDYAVEDTPLARIDPSLLNPEKYVEADVSGYWYEEALQPYHVEVWAEKSTVNDVLVPLCRSLGANYVSGAGYQSITGIMGLLRDRVGGLEKPTRVLYISDYDPAGKNMPKQMARQLQFWIERYASEYDIRVEPIVLTAKQAEKYPPAPDSGAVELDAMVEIDPGRLERIVREHVFQFRDAGLRKKVLKAEEEAEEAIEEAIEEALGEELEEVEEIKAEAEEIYQRYRPRLEALAAELEGELAPLDARLEALLHMRWRNVSPTSSPICRRCQRGSLRRIRMTRVGSSIAAEATWNN